MGWYEQLEFTKKLTKGEDVRLPDYEKITIKCPEDFQIGNHSAIDDFFYCTTKAEIGDYVHIGPQCTVIGGKYMSFIMEHFSFLAAGCRVMCASDEHLGAGIGIPWVESEYRDNTVCGNVTIKQFSGVCTGCILFPGVTINEGAIAGAGCIVRRDLDPWSVYISGEFNTPIKVKNRPKDKILAAAKAKGYEISS